jgi:hypothetical protein
MMKLHHNPQCKVCVEDTDSGQLFQEWMNPQCNLHVEDTNSSSSKSGKEWKDAQKHSEIGNQMK